MAERFLIGAAPAAGPPVEVVLHVEAERLAAPATATAGGGTLGDGTVLSRPTTERLVCDAAVVQVVEDGRGKVLDIGRRQRTIPTLLRRALRRRDGGCRFPGCTNRWVDGHHVVPWSRGGTTALDNLCSLCRLCRARHKRHYAARRIMPRDAGKPAAGAAARVGESA
jgi:hypothetical protein